MIKSKNLLNFFESATKNKNLIKELLSLDSPQKMYNFAIDHSKGGFSEKEFLESIEMLDICYNDPKLKKLKEEDLVEISGGGGSPIVESKFLSSILILSSLLNVISNAPGLMNMYQKIKQKIEEYEKSQPLSDMIRTTREKELKNEIELLKKNLNETSSNINL